MAPPPNTTKLDLTLCSRTLQQDNMETRTIFVISRGLKIGAQNLVCSRLSNSTFELVPSCILALPQKL